MTLSNEQQTAYQRWELASFDERDRPPAPPMPVEDAAIAITEHAERLAAEREAAREQGYQEGLAKGYEEGLAKGREQAQEETQLLRQIATQTLRNPVGKVTFVPGQVLEGPARRDDQQRSRHANTSVSTSRLLCSL